MSQSTGYFHNVFFWLREGSDAGTAQRVAEGCHRYLTSIPGIVRMTVGFPAGMEYGPVDSSYGIALLIEFEDSAAHDAYETHPSHLRFIEEHKQEFERVVVYDAVPAGE